VQETGRSAFFGLRLIVGDDQRSILRFQLIDSFIVNV
jgi:hypothetical protein